jgi:anti-sigma B factor antagonist
MTDTSFTLRTAVQDAGEGPGRTVVTAHGDVDAAVAADFTAAVRGIDADGPLVLDLSGLRYLDSAGLAAVDAVLAARPAIVVVAPDSPVRRAADLVGLPCRDSVGQALAQR